MRLHAPTLDVHQTPHSVCDHAQQIRVALNQSLCAACNACLCYVPQSKYLLCFMMQSIARSCQVHTAWLVNQLWQNCCARLHTCAQHWHCICNLCELITGVTLLQELTDNSRTAQLHLGRMDNVTHAGGCSTLKGTMQDDQGLLWHTRVHEGMYSARILLLLKGNTNEGCVLVHDASVCA